MQLKKYFSAVLAAAIVLNTGAFDVMAAGSTKEAAAENSQAVSAPETVYVDSFGTGERSVSFNEHWRFYLGDLNGAEVPAYNDASWKSVNLPHDYSIDQGFTTASPAEAESGCVLGGTGWYRKTFALPSEVEGKVVSVDFDGVYMNATVYLNGEQLGTHPYGYTPFSFVLPADQLKYNGEENVLAVKVDHKLPSSRWYSGSGIYRDVNLTITDPVHVSWFGTKVATPDIEDGTGTVHVDTCVENDSDTEADVSVIQKVYERGGAEPVVTGTKTEAVTIGANRTGTIASEVTVPEPKLWSDETPNLYTVRTEVYVGEDLKDSYDTEFGFRWIEFTRENGFFLNGKNMKLKGVCMHHDQGALGAEAWERATERQVEKLLQMGVNAIRVTHNPASQVLIDICNEKGMLLIEEAYDCWLDSKNGNGEDFGKWFDVPIEESNQIIGKTEGEKWSEFSLKAMVKRGRNAPSIIMWSLGNEIFEGTNGANSSRYPQVAREMITQIAEEDTTRYVTFGDNKLKHNDGNAVNTAAEIAKAKDYGLPGGIVGYNYINSSQIQAGYNRGWMVYGSETASSVNSRGIYDRKQSNGDAGKGDKRLTSYDKSCVGWGLTANAGLWITMRQDFNAGEFIWTGFDYIGEPTPWNNTGGVAGTWPNIAKSSYFGIIETTGFPKDNFYLYQSQWNDKLHTLHVLPVWDRDEIMVDENGKVEVVVYSDAPVIKLYLNGEEVGTATATRTDTPTGGYQQYTTGTGYFSPGNGSTSLFATFNVPYEAGRLEAKAFDAEGNQITDTDGRSFVETTKKAVKLTAEADRNTITADGKDLSYITIDAADVDGKFVNGAEPEITVSVEGDGVLMALDNGVQNDVTSYHEATRKAGKGKLLAIVQSTKMAGTFTVKAKADGFTEAAVEVKTTAEDTDPTQKTIASYEISRHYYIQKGSAPVLPATVKLNYTDGTSEMKNITWDEFSSSIQEDCVVLGTVADTSLRIQVYITVIDGVAAILNYSAAIGVGAEFALPAARPAVMADGSVLSAEFPVTWDDTVDTSEEGMQIIEGRSNVFGSDITVTASVRVTKGGYKDGSDALPAVPEMYLNGISSNERDSIAEVLTKLKDDRTSKEDVAWSGRGTLDFRLDTAIDLKDFTLYLKETAPSSDTMKVYTSDNNGETWKPTECKISNRRSDGVIVRTFTSVKAVSDTYFRVEFTKNTTLLEMQINSRIPTFAIGEDAALSYLKAGGYTASDENLDKGWFGIADPNADLTEIKATGKDNASVTVLPEDETGVIRILLESEDHNERSVYLIYKGKENPGDAAYGGFDYPYTDMTLSAASYQNNEPASKANDGDISSLWHSRWQATEGSGVGKTDLAQYPEERYLQMALKEKTSINALRYMPRSQAGNGTVVKYEIRVSNDGSLSDAQWAALEPVAQGSWNRTYGWKIAEFNEAVEAQYIRLYGVETWADSGNNRFMSAAEVRVCSGKPKGISALNTSIVFGDGDDILDYTGGELRPEPTVHYTDESNNDVVLVKGTDYQLSYRNNVEPGKAVVVVTGINKYTGIVEAEFTINAVDEAITGYEEIRVATEKGVYPTLPGVITANTNLGTRVMEVKWDRIPDSLLNKDGTFVIQGIVTETKAVVPATIVVGDTGEGPGDALLVTAEDEMVEIEQGEANEGQTVTFRAKTGYEFKKKPVLIKSEDRTSSDVAVSQGQDGSYTFTMPGYAVTIVGEPVRLTYTITYHLGADTVDNKNNKTEYTIETPSFTLKKPVRQGYIFLGWTGTDITEPTAEVTIPQGTTGNLEFTAVWREGEEYNITFDTNGAGTLEVQKVPVTSGKITEPEVKKHGYDLVGWYSDAEFTRKWDFENDLADRDMTLYAKWQEGQIKLNTNILRYIGEEFSMPSELSITIAGETFNTNVAWNAEEVETVMNATNAGKYKVTGTLSDPEGREIEVWVPVSPANIVYFLDTGASNFTANGKIVTDANLDTILNKNAQGGVVPDGAYSAQTGWGYTNPDEEVEANKSGDAYDTIRNMTNPGGRKKTLSYQFDNLKEGKYNVIVGFYDPWGAADKTIRRANITLEDKENHEIATREDYLITNKKETVSFNDAVLAKDGSFVLNIAPKNEDNANCDVMVSFIVIQCTELAVPITSIQTEETAKTLLVDDTYQIEATVAPADTTDDKTLTYTSKSPDIAEVDANGLVTAKKAGTAEIEIACAREGIKASVMITVETNPVPITEIQVTEAEKTIKAEDTYQIQATVLPANTTDDKKLTYTSKNPEVAEVNASGLVTAKSEGTAEIEITCVREGITAKVTITVEKKPVPITAIQVEEAEKTIKVDETYQIQATVLPENTTEDKKLNYVSRNPEVAEVNASGLVTAKSEGTAEIEITCVREGITAKVTITVEKEPTVEKPITAIQVEESAKTIKVDNTYQIRASVEPADTTDDKTLTYISKNTAVATVDSKGLVKAVKEGTAEIEITCAREGISAKVTITVEKKPAVEKPITAIQVEESAKTIKEDETYQIRAAIEPADTTDDKTLTYTSKNTAVATVDSKGLVKAVKEGSAEIEITCAREGISAKVTITVEKKPAVETPITAIQVEESAKTIKVNETYQIRASVKPADTTDDKTLTYTSKNTAVATVDSKGLVKAVKEGTAEIEITCAREQITATVTITVISDNIASAEERSKLDAEVKSLKSVYQDLSKYTAESAGVFQKALEAAEKVLNTPNATKAQVNEALNNLAAAKAGLKEKSPEQPAPTPPKKGYKFKVGVLQYQVTKSAAKNGTVAVMKLMQKSSKKVTIPATVNVGGFTFKVTRINKKVFQKCNKLTEVKIGANVVTIGPRCFYGCKNLKKITFQGTKAPNGRNNAFTGIRKNAKVVLPKKTTKNQLNKFKKTMRSAGKRIVFKKSK